MNERRDSLESGFENLRAERVPPRIEERLRERLLARNPSVRSSRRRIALAAAALVVLGGFVGAAVARWWRVRIDTTREKVEGGTLQELRRDANGAAQYEIELPDGRRVRVDVPPPSDDERRVEVELPETPRPDEEPHR